MANLPPVPIRWLEEAAGWALLMAMLSGAVMGAAVAAVMFGQFSCTGGWQ